MAASRSAAFEIYTNTEFFLKQVGSSAFGICIIPKASARHETSLRWLLIVSGDVELNPGPIHTEIVNLSNSPVFTTSNRFEPLALNSADTVEPSCSYAPVQPENFPCQECRREFKRKGNLKRHMQHHKRDQAASMAPEVPAKRPRPRTDISAISQAGFGVKIIFDGLKNVFKIYRIFSKYTIRDVKELAGAALHHMTELIENELSSHNGVKAHLRCAVKFYKPLVEGTTMIAYFVSKPAAHLTTTDHEMQLQAAAADIERQIDKFTSNGSGWSIDQIEHFGLYLSRYKPIRASTFTKLPRELAKRRAIVNVQNRTDNKCFLWCILAALHPAKKHKERVYRYKKYENELNLDDVSLPVDPNDISKFEENNPGIGINVLGYGEKGLYPLYATKTRDRRVINLLLITAEGKAPHYCLITDLGKLLFRTTKYEGKKFICNYCLCAFNSPQRLDKHLEFCTVDKQRVEMPEDPLLKFRNVHKQLRAPYGMYADFECFPQKDDHGSSLHVPNSFGLLGVKQCCGDEPEFEQPTIYRGVGPVRHFLNTVIAKGEAFIRSSNKPLSMSHENQKSHDAASECYLCTDALTHGEKHRDHCHVCGVYRGALHPKCNLTARTSRDVTIFFHNLKKYDGHLIMQEIGSVLQEKNLKLECIAKSMEDYMSFTVRLKTDDSSIFDLRGLPPIGDFHNSLTKQDLSAEQYAHATNVYDTHDFSNFGEYHDLYLLTDVLLLADVFQKFRNFALEHYGLDPAHYITLPSFSWDALLKHTGVQLELLRDPDMYHFFTAGIRGGISMVSHRFSKANNKYLPDYDPSKPSDYIVYLDANNLYGYAMSQKLPVGDFEWVGEIDAVPDDGCGYVVEVDLEYPPELHNQHNDYPLAAERIPVPEVSPHGERLQAKLGLNANQQEKLIPNLMSKQNYIIHYKTLEQCLKLGMKLKKIHRGIRFREGTWMAPYIHFNTEMRKRATTQFEKDLFKLLNNAVFGKSMDNVFNYLTVKLTADPDQYMKLVASPLYRDTRVFKNDLVAVLIRREAVKLDKPIFTGFTVLELSKHLMYSFHYDYIVKKYGTDARLLFTDTDSLCYWISTRDVYEDMLEDQYMFDTSDYPIDHPLYSTVNKKVIGKMKDETNGEPISEFVGLRSKMYSIACGNEEKKRAKGISKSVVKNEILHKNYKDTLFGETQMKHSMKQFRSYSHNIRTVDTTKISLSCYDDKRFLIDNVTSLAYGHKDIPKYLESRDVMQKLQV